MRKDNGRKTTAERSRKGRPQAAPGGDELASHVLSSEANRMLAEIVQVLRQAFPHPAETRLHRFYRTLQSVLKYVGVPALVLAAVVPVYDLSTALIRMRNVRLARSVYESFAEDLLKEGRIDRANDVIADFDATETPDVQSLYLRAKIFALMAIKQGRQHAKAEDQINVLLRLHNAGGILFPTLGGDRSLFDLEMGLSDIDIQLGRYEDARRRLEEIHGDPERHLSRVQQAEIEIRIGESRVSQYAHAEAAMHIARALSTFSEEGITDRLGWAYFLEAKNNQFQTKHDEAMKGYANAEALFQAKDDKFNLLKVYNNVAMIYFAELNNPMARTYYERQIVLARELNDQTSLARALVNLSLVSKSEGNYSTAVKLALEAREVFASQGNLIGVATTHASLANAYRNKGDLPKALHHAEEALATFRSLNEIRGVANTLGMLADMADEMDDDQKRVFYLTGALALKQRIGGNAAPAVARDIAIHQRDLKMLRNSVGLERFNEIQASALADIEQMKLEASKPLLSPEIPIRSDGVVLETSEPRPR